MRASSRPPRPSAVAAIEWSIALTSYLLVRGKSSLSTRRPALELRLCRLLGRWRSAKASSALHAWRRVARTGRRVVKSAALNKWVERTRTRSAAVAISSVAAFQHRQSVLHAALASWEAQRHTLRRL